MGLGGNGGREELARENLELKASFFYLWLVFFTLGKFLYPWLVIRILLKTFSGPYKGLLKGPQQ